MRRRWFPAACGKPEPGASSLHKKIMFRGERQHARIVTPQFSQPYRIGCSRYAVGTLRDTG
jgi:hypothetical protein